MSKFIIVLYKLDTSVPVYICISFKPMIDMLCCVAALGPALHGQSLKEDVRHCNLLHCSNHANSYNPSQNLLMTNMKMSSYFGLWKKLQLLEEAIPIVCWVGDPQNKT